MGLSAQQWAFLHDQPPYVEMTRGRQEIGGLPYAQAHAIKGVGSWFQYLSDRYTTGFEAEFTGDDRIGRTTRFLYDNGLARWLGKSPDIMTNIARGTKSLGIGWAGYAHRERLLVDLDAIQRVTPENTTPGELTAICSDTASAAANVASCVAYVPGILLTLFRPSSRVASLFLLGATAVVAWFESSTWTATALSTLYVEAERSHETGDYNVSAYVDSIGNAILGVSLYCKYRFIFEQGLGAFRAGDFARANDIMAFFKLSYEDKEFNFPRGMIGGAGRFVLGNNLKVFTGRLMYFTEGARLLFNMGALFWNLYKLEDPADGVPTKVREKNLDSFIVGLATGIASIGLIPCFLNYPLVPLGYGLFALSGGIRVLHSKFDYKDEKVAAKP